MVEGLDWRKRGGGGSGKLLGGDSQRRQTDGQIDRLVCDRYLDEMPILWLLARLFWMEQKKRVMKYLHAMTQPNKNICTERSADVWCMLGNELR